MTDQLVFDLSSREEAPPRRRGTAAVVALVGVIVVAATAAFLLRDRPETWVQAQTPYSESQRVLLAPGSACATVTLTGSLRYERSSGASRVERRYRAVEVVEPAMSVSTAVSCEAAADGVAVSDVRMGQVWSTPGGRTVGRRATALGGPAQSFAQRPTGAPLRAAGLTARGRVCLQAAPSLTAAVAGTVAGAPAVAPLRALRVCAR